MERSDNANRRVVIGSLALGAATAGACGIFIFPAAAQTSSADTHSAALQPGQFIWRPDLSPDGPTAIIVSIPKQLVFVYRNGILIRISTCSTGKPGHETPTGVFTILQKFKTHTSSTYHAPMPDTERLTWQGIALHVGGLPGYPSSHGCVHLPHAFADDVFGATEVGTPVIIAGDHTDPVSIADPGPILGITAEEEIAAKLGIKAPSPSSANAVTAILVSRADRRIYVLENGIIVAQGDAMIRNPSQPLGSNVFIWQGGNVNGSSWQGMGFHAELNGALVPGTGTLERIDGSPDLMNAIRARLRPGSVLVTTDLPATEGTRSGNDFTVMDAPVS
ncbi:MAG TPA: L,D-transpeptidase family protein [Rhizomicrobium sp.]|nr:L,D-transpeptidase family protein [Rhizomicrobium sp.]